MNVDRLAFGSGHPVRCARDPELLGSPYGYDDDTFPPAPPPDVPAFPFEAGIGAGAAGADVDAGGSGDAALSARAVRGASKPSDLTTPPARTNSARMENHTGQRTTTLVLEQIVPRKDIPDNLFNSRNLERE